MTECMPFIHNLTYINEKLPSEQKKLDKNKSIFLVASLLLLACFIVTSNVTLVVGLRKTNKQLTISQKLYTYLSLSDSIVGIVCLPYYAIVNAFSINTCRLRSIGNTISAYSFGVSLGTFLLISVLRNIAIRKPLYIVEKKIVYLVLIVWNFHVILGGILSFFSAYVHIIYTVLFCFRVYWNTCFYSDLNHCYL